MKTFRKILIANRGEIAVRIIRACRDLGISPVAVYSQADLNSLHVRLADEAYNLGPAPSVESYLRIDKIINVARACGADAIHPGYGFLAENPEFARATIESGIVFIGPDAAAMESMGSKINARKIAIEAGVPVVPGTTEPIDTIEEARELAAQFGYPVMLKATAGGGGKGMRLVSTPADLDSSLGTARSEAAAAFGNPEVYIEKAVDIPRHIEIQVFSDSHGNYVHLGERECSIQRRHQKVIEECPSPLNDLKLRARMGSAALSAARAVNYVGAGTVEFLVSGKTGDFYFLEMNTRLQVEHPVTELVTGLDLVREQITVAAGAKLSFSQDDVRWNGHAIECRIYAEDPENNFMPSPGRVTALRVPAGPGVRDDGGFEAGNEVSIYYDPMISKLAVWGRTRDEAIDRMRRALDEYHVGGIKTTLQFFRDIVRDKEFILAKLDTGFISRFLERSRVERSTETGVTVEDKRTLEDLAILAAALARSVSTETRATEQAIGKKSSWKTHARAAGLR